MRALLLLLLIASCCQGQIVLTNRFELLTVGTTTYTNCTVKSFNAAEAIISFSGGGAKVAISNLPPDIQLALKYNVRDAAAVIEARNRAELSRQNAAAQQQLQKAFLAQQVAEAAKQKADEEKRLRDERRTNRPVNVRIIRERQPNSLQKVGAF